MNKRQIDIQVRRGFCVNINKSWFKLLVNKVLDFEDVTDSIELGLVVTDKRTVKHLNKVYRKQDKYTDVLAFPMVQDSYEKGEQSFIAPPNGVTYLGEVFISYPIAVQQALEHKHSIEKELALLTIHGVLHLLGYDHNKNEERQLMSQKEMKILDSINLEKIT